MAHDTVSWHRSLTDPGTSPLDEADFAALVEDIDVDDEHPDLPTKDAAWKCARCDSLKWKWTTNGWICERCGCRDFYNPASPTRYETTDGVWLFMPSHMSPPTSDHGFEEFLNSRSHEQSPHADQGKPESSDGGWTWEREDSESHTTDPVVDPETLQPVGRRRRRRKHPVEVGETVHPALPIPQRQKQDEPNTKDELLQVMRQLLSEQNKSNKSDASWNSRRGPEKGVRWRGGTPPAPPAWKGSSADLRAFARWERRIEIWKLQIRSYMTDSEAALMLFTSLTGEPEQEVEHLDLAKVNCSSGINYIVDSLREPLQQRTLFQKRKLLADYEQVGRNNLESIRQYVNRYKRIERDLETVGISSGSMYDGESRGNRLLERAKLAPDLQRLVLIAAGNSLEFDKIQEAMCLQFPDFRAPPQIYYAGSGNQPRVNQQSNHRNDRWSKSSGNQSASSSSSTSTGGSSYRSGGSKGFGRGNGHRRVFQTEHQADELDDIPENDEQHEDDDEAEYQDACEEQDDQADDDDAEPVEDSSAADIIGNLASVLTVTSKKLQSTVLGRKFSGGGRSIEERKKTSSCTACEQVGHWAGDAICPAGPKPGRKGAGKSDNKQFGGKGGSQREQGSHNNKPKKTFVVSCPDQHSGEIDPDMLPADSATFYNFPARFVVGEQACTTYVTEVVDFAGYMILDTACQRSCLGQKWLDVHTKILHKFSLPIVKINATDTFQFGSGEPETSSERVHIPVAFEGQQSLSVVLGSSVLDVQIPFLASHTMMTKLGFVIDLTVKKVFITTLGLSFDLELRNDHLVAKIVCFHGFVNEDTTWKEHMIEEVQHKHADPEVNWVSDNSAQASLSSVNVCDRQPSDVQPAADMVSKLACTGGSFDALAAQNLQDDVQDGEVGFEDPCMADDSRGHGTSSRADRRDQSYPAEVRPKDMHPSLLQEVRKPARKVQSLPEVRSKVPMGCHQERLGSSCTAKLFSIFCLAASIFGNHHSSPTTSSDGIYTEDQDQAINEAWSIPTSSGGIPNEQPTERDECRRLRRDGPIGLGRSKLPVSGLGQSGRCSSLVKDYWEVKDDLCIRHHVVPRQGMFQPQGTACPVEFFRFGPICTAEMEFADGKNIKLDYEWKLGVPMSLARGERWIGTSAFYIIDQNNHNVNNKTKRQLRGKLRQAIQVFAVERSLMNSKKKTPMSKVDVFETFAGAANISRLAPKFGLKSLSPADYATGFDLELEEDQNRVDKLRRHYRPMFMVQGLRCTEWSLLQDNVNYVDRPQELHERREHSRPMMRKVVSWCREQHDDGNYFLLENPLTSRLWQEPEVQDLMKLPGVFQSECHGGAYGQVDSKGNLVRKGFRFVGNCRWVLERFCRKLSVEQLSECKPLEGKETTLSEEYPHDMVLEILRGIKSAAKEREPERFNRKTFSTLPVQLETDLNKWTDVFKLIEEHFQRTSHQSRVLSNTDPLWKMIKPLVPWHKIERVQIASQPATLRLPMHVPHTHRAWALLYSDGEVETCSEDLSDVRHPRGRFKKPVNFAIFLFGQAENEIDNTPPLPDPLQHPHEPMPSDDPQLQLIPPPEQTGISFAPELRLSPEVKTAISRLHKNLGHPPAAELKKLLAMQGVRDDHLLRAVEGLRCETCLRTKMPDRPPPSTSKAEQGYHQFGDLLQADIFYVRDITGKNYSVLGMICETTHLHAAALVGSRNPAEIADAMFTIWFNPFGLPLTLRVDPDCAFQGGFEQLVGSRGVFIDFIPPEAHNRIGLIERHNTVLRDLCERVIEAQGVTGPDQVKQAVSAGVFKECLHMEQWSASFRCCSRSDSSSRLWPIFWWTGIGDWRNPRPGTTVCKHTACGSSTTSCCHECWFKGEKSFVEKDATWDWEGSTSWIHSCILALDFKKWKETWWLQVSQNVGYGSRQQELLASVWN